MDYLVSGRDRFLDFDHGHVTEAGEVENYRFLENCSKEFAENQRKKSVFNILPSPIMKNFKIGSESLQIFFRLYMYSLFPFKIMIILTKLAALVDCKKHLYFINRKFDHSNFSLF